MLDRNEPVKIRRNVRWRSAARAVPGTNVRSPSTSASSMSSTTSSTGRLTGRGQARRGRSGAFRGRPTSRLAAAFPRYGPGMDFRDVTVAELADQVTRGAVSARELVRAALYRIEALDGELGAFVAVDAEAALAEAAAVDERIDAGEDVGPLAGLPLGVKDLEDAAGYVTTRGSACFAGDAPATADSQLVERLRAAGCVVVGKTNTPELGWKPDTTNALFGSTRNPWDLERVAGGSSGGPAPAGE